MFDVNEFKEHLDILYNGCGFDCNLHCEECALGMTYRGTQYCLYQFVGKRFNLKMKFYYEPNVKMYTPEEFKSILKNLVSNVTCEGGKNPCATCIKMKNHDFNCNCLHLIIREYWS